MERETVVTALAALAQGTRLDIFRLLVEAGAAGVPAGLLGERLGVPNATLSFHLQQLRHAGLVEHERQGTRLIYRANYALMNGLIGFLTENCCQGASCLPAQACCPAPELTNCNEEQAS